MKKISNGISIFIVSTLVILTINLYSQRIAAEAQKEYLQNRVDELFADNVSSLYKEVLMKDEIDLERKDTIQAKIQLCKSVFPLTSYSDSKALENIVFSISDMAPDDAVYHRITDKQLIKDIGKLVRHLKYDDWRALSDDIWLRLSEQLVNIQRD